MLIGYGSPRLCDDPAYPSFNLNAPRSIRILAETPDTHLEPILHAGNSNYIVEDSNTVFCLMMNQDHGISLQRATGSWRMMGLANQHERVIMKPNQNQVRQDRSRQSDSVLPAPSTKWLRMR